MLTKSNTPFIDLSVSEGILSIKLNRLDKKNSINQEMYVGLKDAFLEGDRDSEIRVILISGDETCFTAGNDLKDFMAIAGGVSNNAGAEFIRSLAHIQKPVVAAVGGPAIGIGTTILLHCDLVYAAENAMFRLPFVELGLCPEAGSSFLLPKMAGYHVAAELLLLGEFFDASKAKEIGLVNQVFVETGLMAKSLEKAKVLSSLPQGALVLTKRLMKQTTTATISDIIENELDHFMKQLKTPEARTAFQAFFKK